MTLDWSGLKSILGGGNGEIWAVKLLSNGSESRNHSQRRAHFKHLSATVLFENNIVNHTNLMIYSATT